MTRFLCIAACLVPANLLQAEERDFFLQQIHVKGENAQLARRLQAADLLVRPELLSDQIASSFAALSPRPLAAMECAVGLALQQVRLQKWPDALKEYSQLLAEEGDTLVLLPEDKSAATIGTLQLRYLIHHRLAAAPPSVRIQYRQGVDSSAKKLFEEGQKQRDRRVLRQVVDGFFCSRWAEPALDLLGESAFERGAFDEALCWWRRLSPFASEVRSATRRLVFPDPANDPARYQAKQILAYHFADQGERARQELEAFRRIHPSAKGYLAGGAGNYCAILDKILNDSRERSSGSWTTYAGSAARHKHLFIPAESRWLAQAPAWQVRLREPPAAKAALRPAFHPVIVADKVLVADAASVTGFQLSTGKRLFRLALNGAVFETDPRGRYALTVAGNRIYGRLGSPNIGPGLKVDSRLVCWEMTRTESKELKIRQAWNLATSTLGADGAHVEGAPLICAGQAYVALSRLNGQSTQTFLACLDADTGKTRWLREVCETPEFFDRKESRLHLHLVTMAGTRLVYCTHAGVIAAVDRFTGKRAWAMRYPSRHQDLPDPWPRETNPCMHYDQRIYVAPRDSNRLFCLCALSGRVLWEREGIDVDHLLGIAKGRLLFTTPRGVRAVDAADGLDRWSQPAEGDLPSFGRGLLAGGKLYWPTRDPHLPVRVLNIEDGASEENDPTRLHRLRAGNMAYAHGCLVVAGVDELSAYVTNPP